MEITGLSSLFFALKPDEETAARAAAIANEMRRTTGCLEKLFDPDRYHISLVPVHVYEFIPLEILARALGAGDALAAEPFDLIFDRVGSFGRRDDGSPLVLSCSEPGSGFETFLASLGQAMRDNRIGKHVGMTVSPHLTIYYQFARMAARRVNPINFHVRELVLIQSHLGQSKHTIIERWPLTMLPPRFRRSRQ
jgi:2'-5' RNA ligase